MLLELENAVLNYGKIEALHGISLEVAEGEIVGVIGANGAGKTSTMRALSVTDAAEGAVAAFSDPGEARTSSLRDRAQRAERVVSGRRGHDERRARHRHSRHRRRARRPHTAPSPVRPVGGSDPSNSPATARVLVRRARSPSPSGTPPTAARRARARGASSRRRASSAR